MNFPLPNLGKGVNWPASVPRRSLRRRGPIKGDWTRGGGIERDGEGRGGFCLDPIAAGPGIARRRQLHERWGEGESMRYFERGHAGREAGIALVAGQVSRVALE